MNFGVLYYKHLQFKLNSKNHYKILIKMLKRDLTGKQDLKSQIYDWERFGQIKLTYSTWTTNYRSKSVYFLVLRREFLHLHIISLAL